MQSYIYEDHPIVDEYPYLGDRKNYFPTVKRMVEQSFKQIKLDPDQKNESLIGEELSFGLNKISVTDDNIVQ